MINPIRRTAQSHFHYSIKRDDIKTDVFSDAFGIIKDLGKKDRLAGQSLLCIK